MNAVIAVLSGKGATGKSTISAALACALSELGKSVVCVEADAELRNLDLCLGLNDRAVMDLGDVLAGRCDLEKALISSQSFPGLQLLAAPAEPPEEGLAPLMDRLQAQFDYCLIDYPGGLGFIPEAAVLADRALVVATADPCSQRDAEKAAQLLRAAGAKQTSLVINRVAPRLLHLEGVTLDDTMDRVGLQLLGYVPEDRQVPLTLAAGRPLLAADHRKLRGAAAAFRRIARRLDGQKVPIR